MIGLSSHPKLVRFLAWSLLLLLALAACGSPTAVTPTATPLPSPTATAVATEPPPATIASDAAVDQQLLGRWNGFVDTFSGESYPSEWHFRPEGKLTVVARIGSDLVQLEFDYYFDPDGALRLDDGNGDEPGRREVEFVSENEVVLTAVRDGLVTTLTRLPVDTETSDS